VLYDALDAIGHLLEGKTIAVDALTLRLTACVTPSANGNTPSKVSDVEADTWNSVSPAISESNTPAEQIPAETPTHEGTTIPITSSSEETIRVAVSKLDNLMAQVGELLVSRINAEQRVTEMQAIRYQSTAWTRAWREIKVLLPQIDEQIGKQLSEILAQYHAQFQAATREISKFDQRLRQDTLRLGIVASQLQDNVRHVRMVPFDTLVPGLQRAVRDAAHLEGKHVGFHVEGAAVELDKKILETLKDPLLHLLRNAVSHGIESPESRVRASKPAEGQVTLKLQQRGAEIRITVRDDGAGFDIDRLRQAGSDATGDNVDNRARADDILELAFLPGVTTAQEVTALSGRGIGLDVVRERIETIQGRIQVDTVPGKGASIHLLVPVSLAISQGLLVQIGDERYVLPLLSVEKIIEPRETFTLEGQTMLTVDGVTLPLVALASLLERPDMPQRGSNPLAVILAVAEQRVALLVDDVVTEQELAVKPLGKPLIRVRNVAGVALQGDGKPVIVLNTADLMRSAKGVRKHTVIQKRTEAKEKTSAHILVVDDSITTRTLEKNILETVGYQVTTATDGTEALKRLRERRFDLVVSDVEMPNMDGISLTRHLRSSGEYKDLPLILVTSLESREDRERGMIAGANAYIVKRGFDQEELLKTIQQLVFIEDDK
jgi:two-component system chemotaxis sensor kinase CheA